MWELIRTLGHVTKLKSDKKIKPSYVKRSILNQNSKTFIKKNLKTKKIPDKWSSNQKPVHNCVESRVSTVFFECVRPNNLLMTNETVQEQCNGKIVGKGLDGK